MRVLLSRVGVCGQTELSDVMHRVVGSSFEAGSCGASVVSLERTVNNWTVAAFVDGGWDMSRRASGDAHIHGWSNEF